MSGSVLGQQRALNVAGRVEVLLHARPLQVALVVARVFKGDGGLQGQALKEVGFIEGELAAIGRGDDQLGHAFAFAILQQIDGRVRGCARCGRKDPGISP